MTEKLHIDIERGRRTLGLAKGDHHVGNVGNQNFTHIK